MEWEGETERAGRIYSFEKWDFSTGRLWDFSDWRRRNHVSFPPGTKSSYEDNSPLVPLMKQELICGWNFFLGWGISSATVCIEILLVSPIKIFISSGNLVLLLLVIYTVSVEGNSSKYWKVSLLIKLLLTFGAWTKPQREFFIYFFLHKNLFACYLIKTCMRQLEMRQLDHKGMDAAMVPCNVNIKTQAQGWW